MPSSLSSTSSSDHDRLATTYCGPVHFIAGATGTHGGIARYCREVYKRLSEQLPVRLCTLRAPPLVNRFGFLEHLPLGVEPDEGSGIYHFTRIMGCSLMLWRPVRPAVATVHDLGQLGWGIRYETASILNQLVFRLSLLGLKRMDRIVAVSHATAASLTDRLGIAGDCVSVVHEGVDHSLFGRVPEAKAQLEKEYGIPHEPSVFNILYVGSETARKNLGTLLKALALLRDRAVAARLIKVGGPGHPRNRARFLAQIRELDLQDRVAIVGEVPDARLPMFYSAADAFVLASYGEGFGLPVLEAMACGAPVVCFNVASLSETAGDAALLLDAQGKESLAAAIVRLHAETGLIGDLRQRGYAHAARFTWEKTVSELVRVYSSVT